MPRLNTKISACRKSKSSDSFDVITTKYSSKPTIVCMFLKQLPPVIAPASTHFLCSVCSAVHGVSDWKKGRQTGGEVGGRIDGGRNKKDDIHHNHPTVLIGVGDQCRRGKYEPPMLSLSHRHRQFQVLSGPCKTPPSSHSCLPCPTPPSFLSTHSPLAPCHLPPSEARALLSPSHRHSHTPTPPTPPSETGIPIPSRR